MLAYVQAYPKSAKLLRTPLRHQDQLWRIFDSIASHESQAQDCQTVSKEADEAVFNNSGFDDLEARLGEAFEYDDVGAGPGHFSQAQQAGVSGCSRSHPMAIKDLPLLSEGVHLLHRPNKNHAARLCRRSS